MKTLIFPERIIDGVLLSIFEPEKTSLTLFVDGTFIR